MAATAQYLLPLIFLFGIYAIFVFSSRNGLFTLLDDAIYSRTMPGGDGPIKTNLTGIKALDENLLIHLNAFFLRVVDGSAPDLSLYAFAFTGSFGAAWILITVEGWRKGNAGTLMSFVFGFGFLAQTITYALSMTLYCMLNLWKSRTISNLTFERITIPRFVSNTLPVAVFIGYFIPTALLSVPTSILSMDMKQSFLATWQLWPPTVSFLVILTKHISPRSTSVDNMNDSRANIRSLRYLYAFAFACAAIPHLAAWSISLASAIYPGLFNAEYVEKLHPQQVFVNQIPSLSVQVSSVEEGSLWFLQWDNIIGSVSLMLWAAALYQKAHEEAKIRVSAVEVGFKTCLLVVLAGPVGAAVELMWERDELVSSHGSDVGVERDVRKSQ
ncbi:hypothetical protein NFIA_077520 [Paecilomyces variotii No. 5]|uniref:AtmA protein n=1 Tax=Byssochlamys spectabilis (strain No. 5 / NBRC 109023) TaxID=1356009 RepID=V5HYS9_BYSSN|nr:hypothetical protein NFIA_077520 [Paecilomyces variotii No. 5]